MTERRPGRFITLEGGEGAGKSTQVARLKDWIEARGQGCIATREPGGSERSQRPMAASVLDKRLTPPWPWRATSR